MGLIFFRTFISLWICILAIRACTVDNRLLYIESLHDISLKDSLIRESLKSKELCTNMIAGQNIAHGSNIVIYNPTMPDKVFLGPELILRGYKVKSIYMNRVDNSGQQLTADFNMYINVMHYTNNKESTLKYNLTLNYDMLGSNKVVSCLNYFQ